MLLQGCIDPSLELALYLGPSSKEEELHAVAEWTHLEWVAVEEKISGNVWWQKISFDTDRMVQYDRRKYERERERELKGENRNVIFSFSITNMRVKSNTYGGSHKPWR